MSMMFLSFTPLREFHVGPSLGIASGDGLWAARYILEIGMALELTPTKDEGYDIIKKAIEKLGFEVDRNDVGAYLYIKNLHSMVEC
ncbi:hypothetical protein Tco_1378809 [Tanacetum coccineum]